jgi:hypothetical protein
MGIRKCREKGFEKSVNGMGERKMYLLEWLE